ncbi:MAG TPA: serine/threonine protein kinase [Polyangiaceae bacterium]|nr:serine/threonine protein kinase [Polyangiaceae bacterium]
MRSAGTKRFALLLLALAPAACGRPFKVDTAPGMVELQDQDPPFAYRALAPEGVVVAVRVVDNDENGTLDFWTRATSLRMRQLNGYALVGEADVKSRDGTPGKELRFGHDEAGGKPFLYTVRLFVAQSRVFIVEAGGSKELVERYARDVAWTEDSLRVVCGAVGYPIFASHTCHRW